MGMRVEWLKLMMRNKRRWRRPYFFLSFLFFEVYFQLCKLRGYPAHHIYIDGTPEGIRSRPAEKYFMVWPLLPLSIRLLDWIFYRAGHAEFEPYTPEAFAEARASGRRAEVLKTVRGEFRSSGSFS